jgi:hypothetical protein
MDFPGMLFCEERGLGMNLSPVRAVLLNIEMFQCEDELSRY